MARTLYFDCFSGISGDMTLGSLLHAGMPLSHLNQELAKLHLEKAFSLEERPNQQNGISGIKLEVKISHDPQPHRSLGGIEELLDQSALASKIKDRAKIIFRKLARAEAKVHNIPPEEVHFHEVGALDSLVDIIGSCIGFDYFKIEEFFCGPLPAGGGFVQTDHGLLPVPAPATLELLSSAGAIFAPVVTLAGGIEYPGRFEMVTPTGAAIVSALCKFERPALKLEKTGYGFGSKILPWPNALRIWIGDSPSLKNQEKPTPLEVSLLETNLDDMTPEGLGFLMEKLLEEGALDIFFTPIQMKKNRPGTKLSLISRLEDEARFAQILLVESSAFGIRASQLKRYIAQRGVREVEITGGKALLKQKILGGLVVEEVPEYESVTALARLTGRPWREIYDEIKLASFGKG